MFRLLLIKEFSLVLCFILCFVLSSCNYQFGRGELADSYSTVVVPYAEGDKKGELTAEVVKKISSSGVLTYVQSCGDLELKIKMLDLDDENIGFRYDRKTSGKLKHALIPTETRLKGGAEVSLIERRTGKVIRGPVVILASADFDHTFYASRDQENIFSLGQLDDIDAASEAVMTPFNRELADKIVDYLINSW
jgi:hypothetical protein